MARRRSTKDASPPWSDETELAELFRALGEPSRLALLGRLATAPSPATVTEASTCCGVHISGVSRHLAILKRAGIVRCTKQGREVLCEVAVDELVATLRRLADTLEKCGAECCGEPAAPSAPRDNRGDQDECK